MAYCEGEARSDGQGGSRPSGCLHHVRGVATSTENTPRLQLVGCVAGAVVTGSCTHEVGPCKCGERRGKLLGMTTASCCRGCVRARAHIAYKMHSSVNNRHYVAAAVTSPVGLSTVAPLAFTGIVSAACEPSCSGRRMRSTVPSARRMDLMYSAVASSDSNRCVVCCG